MQESLRNSCHAKISCVSIKTQLTNVISSKIEECLDIPGIYSIVGCFGLAFLSFLWRYKSQTPNSILVITDTDNTARKLSQDFLQLVGLIDNIDTFENSYPFFPDFEPTNLFEAYQPDNNVLEQRHFVLKSLNSDRKPKVVFSSFRAAFRHLMQPESFEEQHFILSCSQANVPNSLSNASPHLLSERLVQLGYNRVNIVSVPGEFAPRGGVFDIYPVGSSNPVRIDFFDDDIEEISEFDISSQKSIKILDSFEIISNTVGDFSAAPEDMLAYIKNCTSRWQNSQENPNSGAIKRLTDVINADLTSLEYGEASSRISVYHSLAYNSRCTLFDYFPNSGVVVLYEPAIINSESQSYRRFWEQQHTEWNNVGLSPFVFNDYYHYDESKPIDLIINSYSQFSNRIIFCSAFDSSESYEHLNIEKIDLASQPLPPHQWISSKLPERVHDVGRDKIILVSRYASRLKEMCSEEDIVVEIQQGILSQGCCWENKLYIITDYELFGEVSTLDLQPTAVKRYKTAPLKHTDELKFGDYIVHIDYGVGKFINLIDKDLAGTRRSFVELEFADSDKLFVPLEQIDRLRKYRFDGTDPKLNKLGKDTWKRTTKKVKEETIKLAKELLELYRKRLKNIGFKYSETSVWETEFAEGFPYDLTIDQLKTWQEVQEDMASNKVMDRLVCGEVGFGKTEIALRASIKAVLDNKQVFLLCPTTVLADQHFKTFSRRFKPFPIKVGMVSRFNSDSENKHNIKSIIEGNLDILIGTHRGLSKDVKFKNLGLLIIDEEQRFGVKQKDHFKNKYPNIDTLTLTATPIPRSLNMALTGLVDVSLIETAPIDRKAVKTYVGEYEPALVKNAILRELGRGGQIYWLHNRVKDIELVYNQIQKLVPELKIIIAHGQMVDKQLDAVMEAFEIGAYDVLLCTTIIENGLDLPNVNTLIVDHAELLGLSQMHQLRGRVGRSFQQAYAYFFHSAVQRLTKESSERLNTIYTYAYLGAGYEIAHSDLRIRGAGNLLGETQHGLVRNVGFDYYIELLVQSIMEMKTSDASMTDGYQLEPIDDQGLNIEIGSLYHSGCAIDIPLAAYIPDDYISEPILRFDILRRIARINNDVEANNMREELADRFGKLPKPVANLFYIITLRNLAGRLGIGRIVKDRNQMRFRVIFEQGSQQKIDNSVWRRFSLLDSRIAIPEGLDNCLNINLTENSDFVSDLHEILTQCADFAEHK